MDLDRLDREVSTWLSMDRIQALVSAHRDAYDRAALQHSPEDGCDAQHFGFTIYKFITKRLGALPWRRPELGVELRSGSPCFRLGVGPFTLASYSCGYSADQDIHESFPRNDGAAPAMADFNQLILDLDFSAAVPRALVLAHLGNPTSGLEALYLAAPGSKENGRIASWSWARELWRWEGASTAERVPQADLPRAVVIPPAPLSLRIPVQPAEPQHG